MIRKTWSIAAALTAAATLAAADPAPAYLDNRSGPAELVRSLYNAITLHQYARAWSYFGARKPVGDYKAFAKGYDRTASVRVKIGKVRSDGAAGSIYATVPVAVEAVGTDGSRRVFSGCYRTRFIEPDIQDPPFRPLFIETGHLARSARTFSEAVPSACTDDAQPIFATGG